MGRIQQRPRGISVTFFDKTHEKIYIEEDWKMGNNLLEKKSIAISIRLSDTQMETIDYAKGGNPRLSNTDMIMAGLNLLRVLLENEGVNDRSYDELVNALIIHDDLRRCIAKPDNPAIDNEKNKVELSQSLKQNEQKIMDFARKIMNKS